jgi:nucleoside-diphosphate-sugar epimerase
MAIDSVHDLDELISCPSDGVLKTLSTSTGRFAVLGAGGKMGFHLSRMLQRGLQQLGRDEPIMVVSRFEQLEKLERFAEAGFDVHSADLCEAEQVAELPYVENVFFLAGVKFGTAANPELLERFNVYMPQLVANHYQAARIVALSTGCVYSFEPVDSGGSVETSELDPPGEYAGSCIGREQAFIENSLRNGTQTSLIRLNYSNECRYGVLHDLAQAVWQEQAISLETGYVNVIWQGDAIRYTIQSLERVSSPPFIMNVTGPEVLSVREIAEGFGRRFDKTPIFSGQESPTAWLNDATLSHRLFGKPSVSLEQMMDWIADWIAAGRGSLGKPTQFQVRDGEY